ncbi:MAG TPA: methyltransferase domain-containing protein [Trebonia sp.]|nr:methyltransferase domain-containing protein [Trebonia sp.]
MSRRAVAVAGASAVALAAGATAWWHADRAPYPYAQRRLLDLPLPFLTSGHLDAMLDPQPGERMLEIGPGTGLQALHVARQLTGHGRLDIVDIQDEMLSHVMRRASEQNAERNADQGAEQNANIVPTRADARELPFPDATFDAAYLVTVLGEIPDPGAALCELRRVLMPSGRLVVGEFFDRHYVSFTGLRRHADRAGLLVSTRLGPPLAYLARLRPACSGHAR